MQIRFRKIALTVEGADIRVRAGACMRGLSSQKPVTQETERRRPFNPFASVKGDVARKNFLQTPFPASCIVK